MRVIEQLKEINCGVQLASISRYKDEMEQLKQAGVQVVFDLYSEAGSGFAHHTYKMFEE